MYFNHSFFISDNFCYLGFDQTLDANFQHGHQKVAVAVVAEAVAGTPAMVQVAGATPRITQHVVT